MTTYKIVRKWLGDHKVITVLTGLTLEEAQLHCKNSETSSRTCKLPHNKRRTKLYGAWFDAYEKE